jgi:hypothetical protein
MLRSILLGSLVLLSAFACKREDGPLSPEASSSNVEVMKPDSISTETVTPIEKQKSNEMDPIVIDPKDPVIPTGPIDMPSMVSPIDETWAHQIAGTLQSYYDPSKSLWRDTWDVSAQATTAIIDFMRLTGSREYQGIIQKVYDANRAGNFLVDSFFSNALWASTWIRAYDLNSDRRYLETAKLIVDSMDETSWDISTCGGGIISSRSDKAKLAVNTLFYIKLNAELHNHIDGDTKYLERAGKGWLWLMGTGLINSLGLVNNGLTSLCKNDGLQTFTHTQGLLLNAATEMNKAAPKTEYLDVAKKAFRGVMANLTTGEGVLREANDSRCGTCLNGERLWKGLFMRSLRDAQQVLNDESIEKFIENNIIKTYKNSRSTADSIGFHWQGPFDSSDAGRQASALELINSGLKARSFKNVALNRVAQTFGDCAPNESGAQAVDGSALTKWCSVVKPDGGTSLIIDLDAQIEFSKIKILHGAAGGENVDTNTRNFTLAISGSANGPFTTVAEVTDNTSTASIHTFNKVKSRFVKLQVNRGGADGIARICEVTVE